ncbi:serine/threonine-protein kinase [Sorangium sp. So ce394]|uniref:serine/threonine-protein kinase n=1 Tax=Sorangium sp. So ce394 TaxID=3133310 RepID=UPI003F5B9DE4
MKSASDGDRSKELQSTERFEILGRLGEGGMGVVYRAYDGLRRAEVALKTLLRMDAAGIYRLKREFRTIADVSHPNLVTLYELISADERWFFTMELIVGLPLSEHVRGRAEPLSAVSVSGRGASRELVTTVVQTGAKSRIDSPGSGSAAPFAAAGGADARAPQLNVARLRAALKQLVDAVMALHDASILHLDLKPSNVLVDRNGRVVVLDFGIARSLGLDEVTSAATTGEQLILGTPLYMAPEQFRGDVSAASDWYAVGVILYEALTGRLPFEGHPYAVIHNKSCVEPPPIEPAAGIPEDLSALCMALLRRDPRDRATGADVLRVVGEPPAIEDRAPKPDRPYHLEAPVSNAPFLGREAQLWALEQAFDDTRRGRAVSVFIRGRSGIGKSALVQQFLSRLSGRGGVMLLAGRCYERESVPFKAFDSVIDALSRHLKRLPRSEAAGVLPRGIHDLARVFPGLRMVEAIADVPRREHEIPSPQELRTRAFRALKELFSALSDKAPLVLYIDDLQWGGRDSALLLADLLAPPDPPAMLVVGTYRDEDEASSPFLRELFASTKVKWPGAAEIRRIFVGPLSDEDTRTLALSLLGNGRAEDAAEIARESVGSPFIVGELVLQARRQSAGQPTASGIDGARQRASLEALLLARFAGLPVDAQRLLEVIAIAGQPIEQGAALRAAELTGGAQTALAALRSGHLVRTGGLEPTDAVETYHDRVRETVAAQVAPVRLAAHHRAVAEALEETRRAAPERLAHHFKEGGDPDKAGEYAAEAAAQAAASLAFDKAARLYRLALECKPGDSRRRRELQMMLGSALVNAGRGAEAAEAYLSAAESASMAPSPGSVLQCQRLAAEQLLVSGRTQEGIRLLREVLSSVGLSYPATMRRTLASLLFSRARLALRGFHFEERRPEEVDAGELRRLDVCYSAFMGLFTAEPARAAAFHARHLLLALDAGEPRRIALSVAFEALFAANFGASHRRQLERATRAANAILGRLHYTRAEGVLQLAQAVDSFRFSWRESCERAAKAEKLFREHCTGVAWEINSSQVICLVSLTMLGDLEQLAQLLPTWIREAAEHGDRYATTSLGTFVGGDALISVASDEPDRMRPELDDAMERMFRKGFHIQHLSTVNAQALLDMYAGRGADAWSRVSATWRAIESSGLMRVQIMRIQALDLRGRAALAAAEAAAHPAPLLRAACRAAAALAAEEMPWSRAYARLLRAGVASMRGDDRAARVELEAAIAGFDAREMELHAAAARRRLGELLSGDEGRAVVAAADASMGRRTVRRPERMTDTIAPGFRRR